jgi:CHAT domain-containing protein/tetratricopeptide (TPR) repeat protein
MMRFRNAAAWAIALGLFAMPLALQAQEDAEALDRQFHALYQAGNHAEAILIAERYAALIKARHGENHPDYAVALSNLGQALQGANRLAEAEENFRKAVAIDEATLGADHADFATDLSNLADLLFQTNRFAEAETLLRRALAIREASLGPDHARVGETLNLLAQLLKGTNRLAEAEPMMRRALQITETAEGPGHSDVAVRLNNLAALLLELNRLAEAEPMMRRALAIDQANFGPDHPVTALRLGNLAQMLAARNALAEAEPLMRQVLQIMEARHGPDHGDVAVALSNLAALLRQTGRSAEAEPLMRRALAIDEAIFGPGHAKIALHLNNLGQVLVAGERLAEAEPLMRRSLAINEAVFGLDHPNVARNLNNLSQLLQALRRSAEAEPFIRRALAIDEANYGPNHPNVAGYLNNLALLLKEVGRPAEAEPLMRRAIAVFEQGLGADNPKVAIGLNNLALLLAERGDWAGALDAIRRATSIRTANARRNSGGSAQAMRRLARESSGEYKFQVLSLFETRAGSKDALDESFINAQRALASEAASAVAEASARFATGGGPLAEIVRAGQDAARARAALDERLLGALAKADKPASDAARAKLTRIDVRLYDIAARLASDFPDYATLTSPEPLTVTAVQALLKPDEALVQFLHLPPFGTIPETGFVWVITKSNARWARIGHGHFGLMAWVTVLRCGLDSTNWTDASDWPEATDDQKQRKADQLGRRERCTRLMGMDAQGADSPPFDLVRAHELYRSLFGQIEPLIEGKHLLIVPAGALTGLPFQTLVTEQPQAATPQQGEDYARAAWLGRKHAITVLPSAASLQALRRFAKPSKASAPFAGFGNPLLIGPYGTDNSAYAKQDCARPSAEATASIAMRGARQPATDILRGGLGDVRALRRQWPLPETADELCAVAGSLGAPEASVHLGQQATESRVKQLSASGALAKARIVHFATHGLIASETQMVAGAIAQPALMLTPPDSASDEDDGLLTAAEVTQLRLDADWVVLSACNTAAASESGAEDLSGLARAFFYAGTRALLVSHWYVDNQAASALMTQTFAILKADPRIGRAEALRRAMTAMIREGGGREHPAIWAPFVVVGEGGAP